MNADITVRMAGQEDLDFLSKQSGYSEELLMRKITAQELILLTVNGDLVGQIQLAFLWTSIPLIELIFIDAPFRKMGLSRALLGFLEDSLRAQGYKVLYSSSQADEPAPQAWHRHMGFEECGIISGLNEGGIGEVFFRKAL